VVTGSHTYLSGSRHTVRTTVTEVGNSSGRDGQSKLDVNPGTLSPLDRDVVQISAIASGDDGGDSHRDSGQVLGIADQVLAQSLPGHKHSDSTTDALVDPGPDDAGS
jgi:hypothetical protein